jgi:tetratricopeptide (TPR) repeat protein
VRCVYALAPMVVLALVAGCGAPGNGGDVRDDRAIFGEAYSAFESGQWQRAIESFNAYLRSAPESTRGEVYYYRGEAQIHLRRREDARADFLRAIDAKPPQPIYAFAYVALGNLYYEESSDARAVECYAEAIRSPPGELPLDQVLLRLAVSLQRTGRWASADKYFAHITDHYPGTQASVEAARRVHYEAFTIQTGAFASSITAQDELARLRSAGFDGRITKTSRGSTLLYAVQAGRYGTYPEAAAAAQRMSGAGFQAMIVP